MSTLIFLSRHPVVVAAMDSASEQVKGWAERGVYHGDQDKAADILVGWSGCDIVERVARAILEPMGIDIDEAEFDAEQPYGACSTWGDDTGRFDREISKQLAEATK